MDRRRSEFTDYALARRPALRRLAYALCGNWHTAEDIVQSAMAKAYVAWPRIHRNHTEDAYVRQIIVRLSIDESRRPWRRETPGLEGFDVAQRPELNPGERHDLMDALMQLPEMQRRTVVLRHLLGLSVAETATDLGISEGTVKSHTSRALARLHELLSTPTEGNRP